MLYRQRAFFEDVQKVRGSDAEGISETFFGAKTSQIKKSQAWSLGFFIKCKNIQKVFPEIALTKQRQQGPNA